MSGLPTNTNPEFLAFMEKLASHVGQQAAEELVQPLPSTAKLKEVLGKLSEAVNKTQLPTAQDIITALIPHPKLLHQLKVALHRVPVLGPWRRQDRHFGVQYYRDDANGVRVCKVDRRLDRGKYTWEICVPGASKGGVDSVTRTSKLAGKDPQTAQDAMAQADMAVMELAPNTLFQDIDDYPGNALRDAD